MSRLDRRFSACARDNRAALIGYLTAFDPDLETSFANLEAACAAGLDVLKTLLGAPELDLEATETSILEQQGAIGELVMDYAFGDVWSRPGLSRRDRSLVVISVLTALHLPHELEIHLAGALHHGVTPGEIEAVLLTAVAYCGFPRAIDGMLLARKVFAAAGVSAGSGTGTARRVDLDSGDEEGRPA